MYDACTPRVRGRVRQTSDQRGVVLEKNNLVVDASVELMLQALLGRDQIDSIVFGDSGGVAVTPGQRSVFNPIHRASVRTGTAPFISKDEGGLSSIGTWTGVFTNPGPGTIEYDMLGLVSQNERLFAALSFPAVELVAGETIAVEWTILLRGS